MLINIVFQKSIFVSKRVLHCRRHWTGLRGEGYHHYRTASHPCVISPRTKWPLIVCLSPFSSHSYTFIPKRLSVSGIFFFSHAFVLLKFNFTRLLWSARMSCVFVWRTRDNPGRNEHATARATSPPHLDLPDGGHYSGETTVFFAQNFPPFSGKRFERCPTTFAGWFPSLIGPSRDSVTIRTSVLATQNASGKQQFPNLLELSPFLSHVPFLSVIFSIHYIICTPIRFIYVQIM